MFLVNIADKTNLLKKHHSRNFLVLKFNRLIGPLSLISNSPLQNNQFQDAKLLVLYLKVALSAILNPRYAVQMHSTYA